MNQRFKQKLVHWLGLLAIALITLSCIGNLNNSSASAPMNTSPCRTFNITNYPPLTQVPENSDRAQFYLNGIWEFQPAISPTTDASPQSSPDSESWGKIRVPGDWQRENDPRNPGLLSRGTGDIWSRFEGKTLGRAWYRKTVQIPQSWAGRRILLNLDRVSTDAQIYVNDRPCGTIEWPYGAVDITPSVKLGEENTLTLLVSAFADAEDRTIIMGPGEIYTSPAKLGSRGLIGEVRLLSIPESAWISDVFVQPSTRNQSIKLNIELTDITEPGAVQIRAAMLDEHGNVEQQFSAQQEVQATPTQTLNVSWNWENPRLWDVQQPNLYTLRLQIEGKSIQDTYDQSFGFREFWIEGKRFYLNGTELRLRPVYHRDLWQSWWVGNPQVMDKMIQGYQAAGFNIAEVWPVDHDERGRWHFRELLAERADLKGLPLMGPVLPMHVLAKSKDWNRPEVRERWEQRMETEMRRYRNHPSIVMWVTNANYYGHSDDQNPRRIGMQTVEGTIGKNPARYWHNYVASGKEAIAIIKEHDTTRSVISHQGAAVGDVYSLNSYLGMIPLQEREEWLSNWQANGDMPYMTVELGTPLHTTMMRARNGFRHAVKSEPLMSEFSAIYLGKDAYELETPDYRQKIREQFVRDQEYQNWQFNPELDFAPAFQNLQQLFTTNTWRSWRTWGITGGMIPWEDGHGWERSLVWNDMVSLPEFVPGQRGAYPEKVARGFWYYMQPEGNVVHPGAIALMENNGPTLAWIAGSPKAFTEKDRSFTVSEKLRKQVVLLNDTRSEQDFQFKWQLKISGKVLKKSKKSGTIKPAQTLFFPIKTTLKPQTLPDGLSFPVEGEISLTAQIGDRQHQDRFPFRLFAQPTPASATLTVFDPVGTTTQMLQQLGYSTVPWDGQETDSLLIIGREALSDGRQLPGDLREFIRNGGRTLIFIQDRQWLQETLGLRTCPHLSRRVFPIDPNHPAIEGLDREDLRDWRGASSLVEAYPDTTETGFETSPHGFPPYGWHWGNQGSVSSSAMEKPHLSSWRPILESEFDLAYTPLMELDYGGGRLILSTLDFADNIPLDPAATQLAKQLLDYAATAPLAAKASSTLFIGSDGEATALDRLGLVYQRADGLSTDAPLAIIGEDAEVSDNQLQGYLQQGGKVLILPRHDRPILGLTTAAARDFAGSLQVPQWPETRGLSASDLRSRADYDTWLIQSSDDLGAEIGADGLLARRQVGSGIAIATQLDPDALNADTNTYLRYTRWRHTRALCQILANLGATFKGDESVFEAIKSGRGSGKSPLYHPDYRTDFELGDNPYRYYRW
ncbi:glycoside hydrolase family 2 protein [Roseofilum casamattae]|uniref:Glycoside hydrolase family 2 TIM barrel-domain containing protein n=1 Tax=Roseofilum casamattae BLCC-M143 TaxID=3022442 RepID=A0ABT7BXN5_9CYAN|nr:sugar-binding domain-containing protein [Roseofilum casamattae]MDJ1183958.1 glycoside hydrolase family 2 TIM barrel-domain containing protein [Roseofilum casamattae BLCC-M143]